MASIHDGWTPQPQVEQEPSMDDRYTALLLAGDIEAWWMISDGQQRNLYEEAIDRAEAAEAEVETAKLELSQERFMRQAAEAEVARLRQDTAFAFERAAGFQVEGIELRDEVARLTARLAKETAEKHAALNEVSRLLTELDNSGQDAR